VAETSVLQRTAPQTYNQSLKKTNKTCLVRMKQLCHFYREAMKIMFEREAVYIILLSWSCWRFFSSKNFYSAKILKWQCCIRFSDSFSYVSGSVGDARQPI